MADDIFAVKASEGEAYMQEYDSFMQTFKKTQVSGEEVGELIMRLGNYYARSNIQMVQALKEFSGVKAVFMNAVDEATSKPMTASKAEVLADATPEAYRYELARVHVQNIEQMLNALKSLQKGVLGEYAHA